MTYADIILPLGLEGRLTYAVPTGMEQGLQVGCRVTVPMGRSRTYVGVVERLHHEEPDFKVRDILNVVDERPVVTDLQLRLWQWVAEYYMAPIGDVFVAAMPAGLKNEEGYTPRTETYVELSSRLRTAESLSLAIDMLRKSPRQSHVFSTFLALSHWDAVADGDMDENGVADVSREELLNESKCSAAVLKSLTERGFVVMREHEVKRIASESAAETITNAQQNTALQPLTEAQTAAYDKIKEQWKEKDAVLLHGVTSGGKTEIYIHLIREVLARGGQVLYLLPEIGLTVQMTERLRRVFGSALGVYHSKYSDAERVEVWQKQLSRDPYGIILGARSAVFLPYQKLQLVIIDEEHDASYKQQEPAPRYHARSTALVLAKMTGAKVLLGTATPSAESYHNAMAGKFGLVRLATRYQGISLPRIEIVDIQDFQHRRMMTGPFSPTLIDAIRRTLEEGRQVILFQNRRGFAPRAECRKCGWVPRCKNCDVTLTMHRSLNTLTCHYCGYTYTMPQSCPQCGNTEIISRGFGTERIEDSISTLFPDVRVARMDLDTTRSRQAYERLIADFSLGRTRILVGTQMISKGLDFGGVGLVGIIDADSLMNAPDFRSYERAFQMMSQVSGRAGRKGRQGVVMLQTRHPDSPLIHEIVEQRFDEFFGEIFEEREMFHYPPFARLTTIYLRHKKEPLVDSAATELASRLRVELGERILGPDSPAVARVKSLFIRKIMIKAELGLAPSRIRTYINKCIDALQQDKRYASLQVYCDVDPD